MKFSHKLWLLCLSLLCLPISLKAAEEALTVSLDANGDHLGPYLYTLKRLDPKETLQDLLRADAFAQAVRQTKSVPNFGYFDRSIYWARISLHNPSPETQEFYILNKYAAIDALTLYQPNEDGTFLEETLGDKVPFVQRKIPYRYPIYIVRLPPGTSELYFKLHTTSSLQFNLSIWSPKRFVTLQAEDDTMLGSIIGIGAVMFFYNLFVYLNFRSKAYLYYVLYIFCFTVFTSNFQGILQQVFFPKEFDHFLAGSGLYLTIDCCVMSAISFARSFLEMKERMPRFNRFLIGWQIITAMNALNGLTFNVMSHPFTLFNNIVCSFFLLSAGVYLIREFKPAKVYVAAWSFLLVGTSINVLANGGIMFVNFYSNWAQPIGATCEFILLSFALTQRVALINQEKHQLQREVLVAEKKRVELQETMIIERETHIRELDLLVADRTRDIQSILHTINQGIFVIEAVDQKPAIQPEYSNHLHQMMNETDLRGKDPLAHIFAKFDISGDRLNQVKGFLDMTLGSSSLSFELNSESLPREASLRTPKGELLSFEFDWSPMLDEGDIVEKILVTLRDVTHIQRLRELSDRQDLEKNIISELVSSQGRFFPDLQKRGRALLATVQNKDWEQSLDLQRRTLAALHTLKGETRVCGLMTLAQAIHEVESDLHRAGAKSSAFQSLQRLLDLYGEIYFNKLGRENTDADEVRAPVKPLEEVILHLEKIVKNLLPDQIQPQFRHIYQRLNYLFGTELQSILSHHLQNLSQLAIDLGKSSPNVIFKGERTLIPKAYHSTLQEIFGHLLSNTMSHGIETKDERRKLGKALAGTISIVQHKVYNDLIIHYRDDGRGLNLAKIRELALARGLIDDDSALNPEALAELIFLPGFSTYENVTLMSGRGVGMDAVRIQLEDMDSEFKVVLDKPSLQHPGCHDFHFMIRVKFKVLTQFDWREIA